MKLLRFIPATLCFCIMLGIVIGYYFTINLVLLISFIMLGFTLLALVYFKVNKSLNESYVFNVTTYLLFILIGITAVVLQNKIVSKNHYSHFITPNNILVLTIEKKLKSNTYYHKYFAKITQINDRKAIGKILLNTRADSLKNLSIDDILIVKSNFKKINKPLNLYQFNYSNYLKKIQVYHQINIEYNAIFKLKNNSNSLHGYAAKFRKKINYSLQKYHFKKDELAIINALLLGQRNGVSKDLLQGYANAGAMHILAVSGLHIGILLGLLSFFFKPIERFKNGKTIKLIILVILLWGYAIIAGLSPSIIRAVSMFTAIAIGMLSNKKTNTLHNLFIAMFFLLLIDPMSLFSVGFQMSYLAVFSIVFFFPLFKRLYNPTNIILKKIWQLFSISCAAQIGVLPISLYYFHQFPSLFFVSSMVIIFFLGAIIAMGIVVIGLALTGILPQGLANFYGVIISKLNIFVSFIAHQESFVFKQISFSVFLLIGLYLVVISFYHLWNKRSYKKLVFALISILLFQVILIFEKQQIISKQEFIVFNKNKQTLLLVKNGVNATAYHSLDSLSILKNRELIAYKIGVGKIDMQYQKMKNIFFLNKGKLLVIDSLGVYKTPNFKPKIVLLTQSPKINLNRLIDRLQPKIIIADGSNYKSYKRYWKEICKKNKISFYDTSITGAYRIK